jgi:hypothetical protein
MQRLSKMELKAIKLLEANKNYLWPEGHKDFLDMTPKTIYRSKNDKLYFVKI